MEEEPHKGKSAEGSRKPRLDPASSSDDHEDPSLLAILEAWESTDLMQN